MLIKFAAGVLTFTSEALHLSCPSSPLVSICDEEVGVSEVILSLGRSDSSVVFLRWM